MRKTVFVYLVSLAFQALAMAPYTVALIPTKIDSVRVNRESSDQLDVSITVSGTTDSDFHIEPRLQRTFLFDVWSEKRFDIAQDKSSDFPLLSIVSEMRAYKFLDPRMAARAAAVTNRMAQAPANGTNSLFAAQGPVTKIPFTIVITTTVPRNRVYRFYVRNEKAERLYVGDVDLRDKTVAALQAVR